MDYKTELEKLHPLEKKTIMAYTGHDTFETVDLAKQADIQESQVRMAVNWLVAKGILTLVKEESSQEISVTDEGKNLFEKGTVEERLVNFVKERPGVTIPEIVSALGLEMSDVGKAVGKFKKANALIMGENNTITGLVESALHNIMEPLTRLRHKIAQGIHGIIEGIEQDPQVMDIINDLKQKRGGKGAFKVADRKLSFYSLSNDGRELLKALQAGGGLREELTQITPEILKSGAWKNMDIRKFDLSISPPRVEFCGRRHPYREFLDNLKVKLLAMGFEEMSGPLVENEFWDMDALFMPQFHPAREIHDAYFVKNPTHSKEVNEKTMKAVAETHENGGDTGSKGWNYRFDAERTKRLVLRSQGTALSARTLAAGPKVPGRYFSIARCFRYDAIDATHAPDFYQVEGIILGEGINFRTLLGILTMFAKEIANAAEFRFDTGYFPYTEPSVELVAKHPKIGWMELGGAGIFRPEVCKPLGVEVPVIAWGIGIDRMAMMALGVNNIRDLFSDELDVVKTMKVTY